MRSASSAIDAASATKATPYEEAIASSAADDPAVDIDGKDPFIIMITSGTTGFPKGCVIDHETYALRSLNNAISKGLNDRERGLLNFAAALQRRARLGDELALPRRHAFSAR